MPTRSNAMVHHHRRKRKNKNKNTKLIKTMDKIVYAGVFVGPIMNIPQLYEIWVNQNAAGVSYISWFGFASISVIWLMYGFVHQEKPIIIMNFLLIFLQTAIAVGALIF